MYNLASVHHFTICVTNTPCYNPGSHISLQSLYFRDLNLYMGSDVGHFQALSCAYNIKNKWDLLSVNLSNYVSVFIKLWG